MTHETPPVVTRKKLIEVALPLDAINKASAREKSIRHGHPSTLHLWWSRKPLAAARSVIFAQMVDDPSANPDLFPTERAQARERDRLFRIIEDLVQWENTTNDEVLQRARQEIWQSWRRACADNAEHPRAGDLFNRHVLPSFHDPFAGGGSLPLEAQRLGLEVLASDLNPVAVLINKAMIEIPPHFAGRPPVNSSVRGEQQLMKRSWRGAQGLAHDVRFYGRWMRDEAERRVGHLYPNVSVSAEMASDRPDLARYVGRDLTVIAWLWARTVKSPNPAFADIDVPLASTFILSNRKGKEVYVEPIVESAGYRFAVKTGAPPESARRGTKLGRGANFRCLLSGAPITADYIKNEGRAARMGATLTAIVAEGNRERVYIAPAKERDTLESPLDPQWRPTTLLPNDPRNFWTVQYGLNEFSHLFTSRQLKALTTLSDLAAQSRERIQQDAVAAGISDDGIPLREGGTGAKAYAEAVSTYLALGVGRQANRSATLNVWNTGGEKIEQVFARQAIPMVWSYGEGNPLGNSTGNFVGQLEYTAKALEGSSSAYERGFSVQLDARSRNELPSSILSFDPPYFDNISFADLSDFFYIWLRRSLQSVFPCLFSTLAVPKADELVATPYRHGSKRSAETFFLEGMSQALQRLAKRSDLGFPVTVYFAFKQSEVKRGIEAVRTGWEAFLDALIRAGFGISGTWPLRTERPTGVKKGTNVLASSIVLACRPRASISPSATRREFHDALRREFPQAIVDLQRSNIAPVDLAQASIGPGMAIFTRYRTVVNADGSSLSVRGALALINATLDEVLAEQEGDFDADSRWALTWFDEYGFSEAEYDRAETLSKAKNTSVEGLVRAGIIESRRGTVRILRPSELDADWDPATDARLTVWEMTQYLIRAIASGEKAAAAVADKLGSRAEAARDLAYRLYLISERKRRATDALQYNSLVQSWPEIARLARERPALRQESMLG
ncbi:MAG: DUF1156 domain-containing protein [Chloroflexi bacterium]|nr:DUF1156 domain-containing protein [Chloroflexota bacterium]